MEKMDSDPLMVDLKGSPDTLLSLYRIARLSSSATKSREVYIIIIEELQRLFKPFAASISFISANSGMLEKEYALGYPPNIDELSLHVSKGITGRVAFIGSPMIVPDVTKDSRYVKLIEGVRCKIAAPLISDGQIFGVVDVDSDQPEAYTLEDAQTLQLVADEAARALQSIWKQRQLVTQSEQLNALFHVGQSIVSKLELQGLWASITESALELTGSRLCTLQIYDQSKDELQLQAAYPQSDAYLKKAGNISLSDSLASAAVRTGKQVEFANITTPDYLDLLDLPEDFDVVSCISTPMIYEGEVIGIINVYTRKRHRFPNNEKRLLQAFASLSAAALQNANLYARAFNSEDKLRKSERLTMLGLLAAEIAHEIRNPLTVIKLLFGSLQLDYPSDDPRSKDTRIIREKINHLEEIVSKVLSFGKAPESLFSHWNVNDLIKDTYLLVRHKMRQQLIDLRFEELEEKASITGNKGQLQQVFLNLIINAAEAMPRGGKLTIMPQLETIDEKQVVAIYFADTGSGIPDDIQDRIFESFLTGKPQGTGLGLSIVKRILRSHHGDISVAHSSAQGTTMRVTLPAD